MCGCVQSGAVLSRSVVDLPWRLAWADPVLGDEAVLVPPVPRVPPLLVFALLPFIVPFPIPSVASLSLSLSRCWCSL